MSNIKLSGLKGQALVIENKDIPSLKEFQDVIPNHYLNCDTISSLRYLLQSTLIQLLVVAIGLSIPLTPRMIPIWIVYSLLSGTTAMGFWVIAHECGHGAFSKNKTLETIIGYSLHSFLLVPYFSWQRSHAIHHRFTNNVTNGETHVPLVIKGNGVTEKGGGEKEINFLNSIGKKNYGILQLLLHLIFGWPAYLLTGSTGGVKYGTSNHFWPIKPFSRSLWPSIWTKKVWISDIGVALMILAISLFVFKYGLFPVIAIYFGPLLVVNGWLVVYTWLHHTDSDVPHLSNTEFSFMRGAFLSIDRPYGKILNFLHHNIGSSHVVHHVCPTIPHYHAKKATLLIKRAFKKVYLFNPDPIPKALWNIACNCVAVKSDNEGEIYVWQSSYNKKD
ncbi:fatty acid desaturase [Prochlorococcus marinus str. MU1404]|uniref:fatty acid desaturase n=1 Tax=Prochlorococcus marinus TaxID=1219 RepID=UPI001ADCBB4D|nr:fatty acid desaturase [Prochlorococcus marinus]MBO8230691.1 fatty acid desaturase [Prochlorococcus marinus XMU1404]MBW3073730.1 fatty acid desaturase [Prochlorococcus marinus str. MU1404]MCR8544977.1 fatty acid desaturase [Prochlorococcus marinus CUG1432]